MTGILGNASRNFESFVRPHLVALDDVMRFDSLLSSELSLYAAFLDLLFRIDDFSGHGSPAPSGNGALKVFNEAWPFWSHSSSTKARSSARLHPASLLPA
jgi:hypothetical protein